MKREIIHVDQEKCNGCGLCITACHEGALAMVDGKAQLISESYCDGLGACLPDCPTNAISIIEREADAFTAPAPGSPADLAEKEKKAKQQAHKHNLLSGCPGSQARMINHGSTQIKSAVSAPEMPAVVSSQLQQWPVQIKLIPTRAPYFDQANLLVAADCAAYARASFHHDFMKDKITVIGCPKLDAIDYADKLTAILLHNDIKRLTVVRMEVPCCGGLEYAVKQALQQSGKMIPWQVITLGTNGDILDQ